ncbi:MAG: sulfatase modifying factor 1 [Verrucomicrobiales bacterium]|jgi:sulfatase modifying factor 1
MFRLLLCFVLASAAAGEENSVGIELIRVEAGEYLRGAADQNLIVEKHPFSTLARNRNHGISPSHPVRISKSFWIGSREITVAQFRAFVEATDYETSAETNEKGALALFPEETDGPEKFQTKPGCNWRNPGFAQTDDHPVVCVSWKDAVTFCEWLSKKENRVYRLPTEAEWEFAARAGSTSMYLSGDSPDGVYEYGNVADAALEKAHPNMTLRQRIAGLKEGDGDGFVYTAPTGSLKPNAWGLFDTHGNVWEWCSDRYMIEYYGELRAKAVKDGSTTEPAETVDPTGPESTLNDQYGEWRAMRGGGWTNSPITARTAWRGFGEASDSFCYTGFRVVVEDDSPR